MPAVKRLEETEFRRIATRRFRIEVLFILRIVTVLFSLCVTICGSEYWIRGGGMKCIEKAVLAGLIAAALCGSSFAEIEKKESRIGAAPFPAIAYTPETSLLFGGGAVLYGKPADAAFKTDSVSVVAFYTLKNQFQAAMTGGAYFLEDNLLVRVNASGSKFPSEFYGIGSTTAESGKEKYTPVYVPVNVSILCRVMKNLYAGPSLDYKYEKIISAEKGGVLDRGLVSGTKAGSTTGAGAMAAFDTRDSEMNPHEGFYSEARAVLYQRSFGGNNNFFKTSLDVRSYISFGASTLGLQLYGASVSGDVPFYYNPSLGGGSNGGGDCSLRGYLNERYIDRNLVFFQTEYRIPVWSRLGVALFAGAGEVASDYGSFGEHPRAAAGAGLRCMIDKEQKINLRMDVSYNGKESYAYLNILEAF
jgi:hypothetical protein